MIGRMMQWFVQKDESITEDGTFRLDYHQTWGGKRFPFCRFLDVTIELYSNDNDEAPQYKDEAPMTKVCSLDVKLDKVPERYFINGKAKPVPGVNHFNEFLSSRSNTNCRCSSATSSWSSTLRLMRRNMDR